MKLNQLVSFLHVAEHGSLAKAAVANDCAESLISRHVAALESEWGDRLFERTGRGMALSDFGRRMLAEVRLALNQVERLGEVARESAGVPAGTVNIGVLPSLSSQLLPALFADLRKHAPGVHLQATEGFSGDLDEQVTNGRLDIAVINRYGAAATRSEEVLGSAETWLIGMPGSALVSNGTVTFKELSGVPLVLPAVPNGLRVMLDHLARRHGVDLHVVMAVGSSNSMKNVARSGLAYTLLPRMAVQEDLDRGTLAAARLVRPNIRRIITLSLTTQRPLSRAARHVASRIRALAPPLIT